MESEGQPSEATPDPATVTEAELAAAGKLWGGLTFAGVLLCSGGVFLASAGDTGDYAGVGQMAAVVGGVVGTALLVPLATNLGRLKARAAAASRDPNRAPLVWAGVALGVVALGIGAYLFQAYL